MRRVATGLLLGLAIALAWPAPAFAHPLGNFTVNRYSRLEVEPERVTLRYVLDLAEIPTLQELAAAGIDGTPGPAGRESLLQRFMPRLRDGARLTIAHTEARWTMREGGVELVPGQAGLSTLRVSLTFVATLRVADGAALEYRDTSFADRIGWREVILRAGEGVRLVDATVTSEDGSDELRRYPNDPALAPLAVSSASARISLIAHTDPRQEGSVARGASGFGVDAIADPLADLVRAGSAGDVLATALALVAAAGIGAVHALTPGHGKTVVAAYLVGTRGTFRQALALGGVVALSHTAGVLGLAIVVLGASGFVPPERFYPYLSALSALIVLGIGLWLAMGLLRGRADGHTHEHGHDHTGDGPHAHDHGIGRRVGWPALVALGVSGGIIPSASALLLLLAAIGVRRPDLGVILILAFGVGMAAVLVGIGLTLVGTGRIAVRRFADGPAVRRIAALLPAATAGTVLLVGIGLTIQAGEQLLAALP